jgi:hypothetical protein
LRIKDIDIEQNMVMIKSGKGDKDEEKETGFPGERPGLLPISP